MQILPLLTLQGGISTFLFWQLELMFIEKLLIWRDNRILDSFVPEYISMKEKRTTNLESVRFLFHCIIHVRFS